MAKNPPWGRSKSFQRDIDQMYKQDKKARYFVEGIEEITLAKAFSKAKRLSKQEMRTVKVEREGGNYSGVIATFFEGKRVNPSEGVVRKAPINKWFSVSKAKVLPSGSVIFKR